MVRPVAVVVPLPPSYRGGTEEYAYRLVARFSARFPVELVTTTVRWEPERGRIDIGSAHMELLEGREVFERPVVARPRAYGRLGRLIDRCRLVQLHMPFPWVERWVAGRARRRGVPLVLTYHMDAEAASGAGGAASRLVTGAYRSLSAHPALRQCSAVVSNSLGYARASPVLSHHLEKVRVIHKGVDPARLGLGPGGGSTTEGVPTGRRVVFVGRLVPYKGVPVLLDAADRLAQEGFPVQLEIAGRGPLEAEVLHRIERSGRGGSARLLGFVPDADLGALYRSADVVVVPSLGRLESTATSLEEAVACGTPIVGSSLPGADETLPNDGVRGRLVPPGDARALASAIREILGRPRPSPLPTIRTWDDVAEEYLRLFQEVSPGDW